MLKIKQLQLNPKKILVLDGNLKGTPLYAISNRFDKGDFLLVKLLVSAF